MRIRLLRLAAVFLLLAACDFSLAGDLTPPPEALISEDTATQHPLAYPEQTPEPENGLSIYTDSCAPCHGSGGLGDGPQALELPFPPSPLGDPDLAYGSAPNEWYQFITAGNLDRFMPPFAEALSLQERWDVLAYSLSLGWDQDLLALGEALYLEADPDVHALDLPAVAGQSVEQLAASFTGLADQEALALAIYVQARTFGFEQGAAEVEPPAVAQEPATTGEVQIGTVGGQVINGTTGQPPTGLPVTLHAYEHTSEVFTLETTLAEDGSFVFENVDLQPELIYFASVDYEGLTYFSEFLSPEGTDIEFGAPIEVYETTTDLGALLAERVHLVFEFPSPGRLRVVELVLLSNLGDRAVAPGADDEPVLHYELPAEASNLVFEQGALGERYVGEVSGFGDLRAVLPGEGSYQLLFAYDLPYNRGQEIELQMAWPIEAVVVFVPEGEVELSGEGFEFAGQQHLESGSYLAYSSGSAFAAGEAIQLQLSGGHPLGGEGFSALANSNELLVGLVALTAVVAAAWLYLRRNAAAAESADAILDEIIALDERYAEGQVSEAVYTRRREVLKARLRLVVEEETGD